MFDSIHLMKPEYLFRKNDENCLLNTSGIYFFFYARVFSAFINNRKRHSNDVRTGRKSYPVLFL